MKVVLYIAFAIAVVTFHPLYSESTEIVDGKNWHQGTWKFEKTNFKKNHPWLPGFMVNKALKTRLVLTEKEFIQYKSKGVLLKQPMPLTILNQDSKKVEFHRLEDGKKINFSMELINKEYFYIEGNKKYKVLKIVK